MPVPAPRPAVAAAPKKPVGLFVCLGIVAVLCLALAGLAGWLWMQQSSQGPALTLHEEGVKQLAQSLDIAVQTTSNAPINWQDVWQKSLAGVSNNLSELRAASTRVSELEKQLDESVLTAAQNQQALAEAQRKASESADAARQLEDLKKSSAAQVADLKAQLASTQKALEDAKTAPAAEAPEAATEPAAAAADTTAAAPADTAAVPVAAPADQEPAAPAAAAESIGSAFTFPPDTSRLLKKAAYDADSQKLTLVLVNGQKLAYRDVPQAVYEGLAKAPVVDVFYRMKIVGDFKCDHDDIEALRAIEKAH